MTGITEEVRSIKPCRRVLHSYLRCYRSINVPLVYMVNSVFPLQTCLKEICYPDDMPSSSPGAKQKLISGVYGSGRGNNSNQVFKMEHSAFQGRNSQWNLEVKYKPRENKASPKRWVNVWNFYPDAKVELKHNEIKLTISSPNEDHEFAVFGTPEIKDKKRMQMGIFGGNPTQVKHWNIFVILFDDTMMAFKRVCEREKSKGRQLLTTLAGLLVSNSDEDITIDISALEGGWKIIGSNVMTIKSKDAWNSPENSTDFPCCVFEIAHVNETKESFFCGIQASHLNDTAETELVAFFEQEQENEVTLTDQNFFAPPELTIIEDNVIVSEAFVILQMLVFFVGCLAGSGFDPHPLKAEETDGNVLANEYNCCLVPCPRVGDSPGEHDECINTQLEETKLTDYF